MLKIHPTVGPRNGGPRIREVKDLGSLEFSVSQDPRPQDPRSQDPRIPGSQDPRIPGSQDPRIPDPRISGPRTPGSQIPGSQILIFLISVQIWDFPGPRSGFANPRSGWLGLVGSENYIFLLFSYFRFFLNTP